MERSLKMVIIMIKTNKPVVLTMHRHCSRVFMCRYCYCVQVKKGEEQIKEESPR